MRHRGPGILTRSDAKFPLEEAFRLRYVNRLSFGEIAQRYGVTRHAIRLRLKRFAALLKDPEAVAAYKVHEPDILDATRMHLVRHMLSPAKLAAANVNNLAYSFRQLFDASRLLRGESTSNVGLHVSLISDAVKERAKSTIAVDVEVPAAYDPTI